MPTNNYNQRKLNATENNLLNVNFGQKLWFIVAAVIAVCAACLIFFKFVNPSYDEEAALKMKPIFFGNTRVDYEPVNSITLFTSIFCPRRNSFSLMICSQMITLRLMSTCI